MSFWYLSIISQTLPDKIVIIKNIYQNQYFSKNEEIFKSDTIVLSNKKKINNLYTQLVRFDKEEQLLNRLGIDTTFTQNSPDKLLKGFNDNNKSKFDWNQKQKEFIFKKLTDINVYKSELNEYLYRYNLYSTYHHFPKFFKSHRISYCGMGTPIYNREYLILLYNKKDISDIFTSRKCPSGFNTPYKNRSNRATYDFKIDLLLNKLFKQKINLDKLLKGDDLLKYIVNQIIRNNTKELYKLSAYSFEKEISELSTDFDIISSEEVYGRGRYIWDEPKTIKVSLKNKYMLPNVYLQFLDSKYGSTLYSRDSIKKDYKEIISRVQAISFITNYLKQDSSARLDIYYFNNSGINKYNIEEVNKKPSDWKKQDEYIESLKWYTTNNIKPSFDLEKAIKTSERINCGCNYKLDSEFIKKAIFIEITSKRNASSIWFLLPDNTLILYHVNSYNIDDVTVLDIRLNSLGDSFELPFACLRFDKNGKLFEKK